MKQSTSKNFFSVHVPGFSPTKSRRRWGARNGKGEEQNDDLRGEKISDGDGGNDDEILCSNNNETTGKTTVQNRILVQDKETLPSVDAVVSSLPPSPLSSKKRRISGMESLTKKRKQRRYLTTTTKDDDVTGDIVSTKSRNNPRRIILCNSKFRSTIRSKSSIESDRKAAALGYKYDEIKKQIEYYLSDTNLASDIFYRSKITKYNSDGWFKLSHIMTAPKIQSLSVSIEDVVTAVSSSVLVETGKRYSEEESNKSKPKVVLSQKDNRSIFVSNRDRMMKFYRSHPRKMEDLRVQAALRKHAGNKDALYALTHVRKLPFIEETLRRYAGKEDELYALILDKYGHDWLNSNFFLTKSNLPLIDGNGNKSDDYESVAEAGIISEKAKARMEVTKNKTLACDDDDKSTERANPSLYHWMIRRAGGNELPPYQPRRYHQNRYYHHNHDDDYSDYGFDGGCMGYSGRDCDTLLEYGIKPWDDDAGAMIDFL